VFIQCLCLGIRKFNFRSILSFRSRLDRALKLSNFWQKIATIFATFFKIKRAPAHRGPLGLPWSIFAFPISESSKFFCGVSWAPRATFKLIKMGGIFFGRNFFLSKSQFLTTEMDSRAKTK
jgi:hypothetical protein